MTGIFFFILILLTSHYDSLEQGYHSISWVLNKSGGIGNSSKSNKLGIEKKGMETYNKLLNKS